MTTQIFPFHSLPFLEVGDRVSVETGITPVPAKCIVFEKRDVRNVIVLNEAVGEDALPLVRKFRFDCIRGTELSSYTPISAGQVNYRTYLEFLRRAA